MERDDDSSSALHGADLEPPEQIGRNAGERAVARLNPRKVSTKKVPVVFDRRVAGGLLGHLASAINGSAVARKTSFLRDLLVSGCFGLAFALSTTPCACADCARGRLTVKASRRGPWRSSRTECSKPGSWIARRLANSILPRRL